MSIDPGPAARQIVLLGASNVAIGFPLAVRLLQAGFRERFHFFGAFGHGRSYGTWSTVLRRALPGIAGCGLWDALNQPPAPASGRFALVTDVGNDLIYGASPAQIAEWVEECLQRLAAAHAHIVLTRLPLASVRLLSPWRFACTRTLFFPFSGATLPIMLEQACELDGHLQELGRRYGASLIEPPGAWYGFDPIHIRYTRRGEAWRTLFSSWPGFEADTPPAPLSPRMRARLRLLRPAVRRLFGREQRTAQPALESERLVVSLY